MKVVSKVASLVVWMVVAVVENSDVLRGHFLAAMKAMNLVEMMENSLAVDLVIVTAATKVSVKADWKADYSVAVLVVWWEI